MDKIFNSDFYKICQEALYIAGGFLINFYNILEHSIKIYITQQ